ncbi:MAG: S-layer homology domain-containing protein [Candidatus Peribacteraceae bacterium]|nr:S-layer homology domain-containing protein [Candidatus Peribacteraceae bacterium]
MRTSTFLRTSLFVGSLLAAAPALALFSDVPLSHVNYDAIKYVQMQGIVSGYPDGSFRPNQEINRAEFVKIIVNVASPAAVEGCLKENGRPFRDVAPSEWFAPYVCAAKLRNLVSGYPDGTFKPEHDINFVEAAKIIVNALSTVPEAEPAGGVWYRQDVETLANANAIPLAVTDFDYLLRRGDMAEIIYRLMAGEASKPSRTYEELADEVQPGEEWPLYDGSRDNFLIQYPPDCQVFAPVHGVEFARPGAEDAELFVHVFDKSEKSVEQVVADVSEGHTVFLKEKIPFQATSVTHLIIVDADEKVLFEGIVLEQWDKVYLIGGTVEADVIQKFYESFRYVAGAL